MSTKPRETRAEMAKLLGTAYSNGAYKPCPRCEQPVYTAYTKRHEAFCADVPLPEALVDAFVQSDKTLSIFAEDLGFSRSAVRHRLIWGGMSGEEIRSISLTRRTALQAASRAKRNAAIAAAREARPPYAPVDTRPCEDCTINLDHPKVTEATVGDGPQLCDYCADRRYREANQKSTIRDRITAARNAQNLSPSEQSTLKGVSHA